MWLTRYFSSLRINLLAVFPTTQTLMKFHLDQGFPSSLHHTSREQQVQARRI
jgi:hypothetical protein